MPIDPMLFMPPGMQQVYAADPRITQGANNVKIGSSTEPVKSPLEGLARALQGVVGAYSMRNARDEYSKASQDYNSATSRIFNATPLPWSADQSKLGAMASAAQAESETNPLVTPLTQQLTLANADPATQEKQINLGILKALLGQNGASPAPAGAPPGATPAAGGSISPAAAPLSAEGINEPMALPAAAANPASATPPAAATPAPAGGDLSQRIMNDPQTRLMASIAMPKVVEALDKSPGAMASAAAAKKTGEKAAEQVSLNQEIQSKGALALQAVQRMKDINGSAPAGDTAGAQAFISRNASSLGMGDGQAATDYSELKQLSGLIKAMDIKPLFQGTGQIRVAELKMLDDIENIDPHMSAPERRKLLDNVETMLKTQMSASETRAKNLSTPGSQFGKDFQTKPFSGSAPKGARVSVLTPDGQRGTVDAADVDELVNAGGKVLQ